MARFDKVIPPGGEGKVVFAVRTKGSQGPINKVAVVYTNDPAKKVARLRIKAFVKVFISLSSRYVYLFGNEGQSITKDIEVRGELDKPLKLTPGRFNLAEKLTFTVEEIEKDKKFRIHFRSIPCPPQTYHGFLKLKTNYPEKPEIVLRIRGWIQEKK